MPYTCKFNNDHWDLIKNSDGRSLGTHSTKLACQSQMRAVYASESKKPTNILINRYVLDDGKFDKRIADSGDEVDIYINSQGGDFLSAITLFNKFRNSGKKVNTYIDPFAFSAAFVLALAGDKVYMVENGAAMIHAPMRNFQEPQNADELTAEIQVLRKYEQILITTLMSKTQKTEAECRAMISKDTWFTAQEAKDMGIVDEIIPITREVQVENTFPPNIVLYLKEKGDMPLNDLCKEFGVQEDEESLRKFINSLKAKIPGEPVKIPSNLVNSLKTSRETILDALVANGKATPAVITDLKTKYLLDARLTQDLQTENAEFDNIVASFNKNEVVMSFKGKSGTQKIDDPLEDDEETYDDNILTRDAKKRAGQKVEAE